MGPIAKRCLAASLAICAGGAVSAAELPKADVPEGVTAYKVVADYEDVRFGLENAIVNHGLVIDYASHIGEMLSRTGADVGSSKEIYTNADAMLFCSAVLSRKAMEADPANISYCPYVVFAYETPEAAGNVTVGFRRLPETGSDASKAAIADVNALLDEIIREAAEN